MQIRGRHNFDKMLLNHKKWNISEDILCIDFVQLLQSSQSSMARPL